MDAPAVPNLTAPRPTPPGRRDLATLPKAHLHLHFTGAMRPTTMVEMARTQGVRLPPHLLHIDAASMPADGRGWFRFQRAYDSARHLVRSEAAMRRLIREAAEDDAAEGSVRMEIQADPTSYAPYVGGITPALEIIIDEARLASRDTGVDIGVIVAASRMKHPLDARTLARLASSFAGDGPGDVVGFGLSNDERVGSTASFAPAFRIARRAGLVGVPHGGELLGPSSVREVVAALAPARLGHGVRTSEDPALLRAVVDAGIALEVCPTSNVHLGVYTDFSQVPRARRPGRPTSTHGWRRLRSSTAARRRACVGCAHFPHNLACNSPTPLSNIETRTLISRGFRGGQQNTLRGIACEIWGALSQSGCFFPIQPPESATSGRPQTPASHLPTTASPIVQACTIMET